MLTDDEGQALTDPELEICFEECGDDAPGIKMLGYKNDLVNLLQIDEDDTAGFRCENWKSLNVLYKESDLKFGNWKKSTTILSVPCQK
jgi:hypothetical protein